MGYISDALKGGNSWGGRSSSRQGLQSTGSVLAKRPDLSVPYSLGRAAIATTSLRAHTRQQERASPISRRLWDLIGIAFDTGKINFTLEP